MRFRITLFSTAALCWAMASCPEASLAEDFSLSVPEDFITDSREDSGGAEAGALIDIDTTACPACVELTDDGTGQDAHLPDYDDWLDDDTPEQCLAQAELDYAGCVDESYDHSDDDVCAQDYSASIAACES